MPVMLIYSFLEDLAPFPDQIMDPTAYRYEVFDEREQALRKARYVASHSRVTNLAIWDIAAALDDAAIRSWIAANPAADLDLASEAQVPHG